MQADSSSQPVDDDNDGPSRVFVDGAPVVSLTEAELNEELSKRGLQPSGSLDEKRMSLEHYERNNPNSAGGGAKSSVASPKMPQPRREYPTEIEAAGSADGDDILHAGILQKKATSGSFLSSLTLPQKRFFVLVSRHNEDDHSCDFVLSYFKKEHGPVINTWIIDSVCVVTDLTTGPKKQTNGFLLSRIHNHPKTRLNARAANADDHQKWVSLLSGIVDGSLEQKLFGKIRARREVMQFQSLVHSMLLDLDDVDSDEYLSKLRDSFSSCDWGETTVEFCDQTLDIFAQATAIKKLIAEMKQHLASRGESATSTEQRRRRRESVSRRKSNSRNTFL